MSESTTVDTTADPADTVDIAEGAPEAEGATEAPKGNREAASQSETDDAPASRNREARYRVERNEARAERDALAQRIEQLQTRELERIASKSLSNPADLLTLSGKSLADFLGEDGELDNDLVLDTANDLLGSRPGLRPNAPAVDPSQGLGSRSAPQLSFSGLFR